MSTQAPAPAEATGSLFRSERAAEVRLTRIPLELIVENESNPNVQNRKTFDRLKADITEDGFDEAPHVVPMWGDRNDRDSWKMIGPTPDAPPQFYRLAGGQWRRRALLDLGYTHADCVVKTGWDELKFQLKTTARNINRGALDDDLLTKQVNDIITSYSVTVEQVSEAMGFETLTEFMAHYQHEQEQQQQQAGADLERMAQETERELANVDNLQLILQELLKRYGDTIPADFAYFFYLRRWHLMVRLDDESKKAIERMVKFLKGEMADALVMEEKGFPITSSKSINDFLVIAIDAEIEKRKKAKKRALDAVATPDDSKAG